MSDPAPDAVAPTTVRHPARILIVLAAAALLVNFIETMLVPALPRLSTFFDGAPYTTVAWALSAYLVVGVGTTPVFAKLGDLYGKRRILTIVLSVYAVAIVLAPLTPNIATLAGFDRAHAIYFLIAVRGLQGLGLAMFPLALAMVADSLPKAQVAPAQGLIASMFAAGAAVGLVGGSWILQNSGWQVAYEVVTPFALVLPILAATWLPETHKGTGGSMDLPGAALLGGALASFLLGLTLGPSWGWSSLTGGAVGTVPFGVPELFVLAALLAVGFVLRERTAPEPIIALGRLGERNLALAYLAALLVGTALFTAFVAITVLVEFPIVGLGLSVMSFGLASVPTTVSMFIAAPLAGQGVAKFGPRPMVLLGATTSMVGFLALLANHGSWTALTVEAVPTFVGLIITLVSVTNVVALSSRRGETGIHMGLSEMLQDLGASAGPVVVATLLATFTRTVPLGVPGTAGATVSEVVPSGTAFTWIFLLGIALTATLGIIGLALENYRVEEPSESGAASSPAPG
ncbi:MAG TPA: MFS transporter [Thermoplasmata archaeon]|nr:MFS transporter [Thermoplasmata archaeon]